MARKLSESDAESYRDKARRRKQRLKTLKGELQELRETRKQEESDYIADIKSDHEQLHNVIDILKNKIIDDAEQLNSMKEERDRLIAQLKRQRINHCIFIENLVRNQVSQDPDVITSNSTHPTPRSSTRPVLKPHTHPIPGPSTGPILRPFTRVIPKPSTSATPGPSTDTIPKPSTSADPIIEDEAQIMEKLNIAWTTSGDDLGTAISNAIRILERRTVPTTRS
ncbi:hypothetical protein QCA50_009183 [Cerrena zonata]|uniref:DUF1216 domain-containing protein n=1 Tax=Cerrena zonata TaxID=2478898 RepID=A0AAW0G9D8_9APHY